MGVECLLLLTPGYEPYVLHLVFGLLDKILSLVPKLWFRPPET